MRYEKKLHTPEADLCAQGMGGILLQLEVTSACSHRCVFCPNQMSRRKKQAMDYAFARRIISECAAFLGKDKRICFHMNGEPMLYPKLPELVALAREEGYDYIFLTTNGSLATPARLDALFRAGLDSIKFSINAGTRESYKAIHGADDFEKAIAAVKYASMWRKKEKSPLRIYVSCVGTRENKSELKGLHALLSPYADEILFYYPSYAGQQQKTMKALHTDLEDLGLKTFSIRHTAPYAVLFNSINVTAEGYLATCCSTGEDLRLAVEDLHEMPVKDAWLGARMEAIRKKHMAKDLSHTPCASCVCHVPYEKERIDPILFPHARE